MMWGRLTALCSTNHNIAFTLCQAKEMKKYGHMYTYTCGNRILDKQTISTAGIYKIISLLGCFPHGTQGQGDSYIII